MKIRLQNIKEGFQYGNWYFSYYQLTGRCEYAWKVVAWISCDKSNRRSIRERKTIKCRFFPQQVLTFKSIYNLGKDLTKPIVETTYLKAWKMRYIL